MLDYIKMYNLIDPTGNQYESTIPGTIGGHRKLKIFGRLDCPSALKYIAKGQYVQHRVFFADEETAVVAGYRPCGVCMKNEYKRWKMINDLVLLCTPENLHKKSGYREDRYINITTKIADTLCSGEFNYGNYVELSADAIDRNCNNAGSLDLNTCIATLICIHRQQHFAGCSDVIGPRLESGMLLKIAERIKELVV